MDFRLITLISIIFFPCIAMAEIPRPYQSNSELLGAERLVLCSDFEEINASRVAQFLTILDQHVAGPEILDGPKSLVKADGFNALVVISAQEPTKATLDCAIETVPYGIEVSQEILIAVERLQQSFEDRYPNLAGIYNEPHRVSANFYHREENWLTIVSVLRTSSTYQLNETLIGLFDLPGTACDQNLACLSQ
jgi:hypothetical protein